MNFPGYDLWLRTKEEAARQAAMASSSATDSVATATAAPGALAGDIAVRENDAASRQAADMAEATKNQFAKNVLLAGGIVVVVALLMHLSSDNKR